MGKLIPVTGVVMTGPPRKLVCVAEGYQPTHSVTRLHCELGMANHYAMKIHIRLRHDSQKRHNKSICASHSGTFMF